MRAGKLTHRLTLQRPAEATDTAGGVLPNWADVPSASADGKWWAEVEPLRGAEVMRSQRPLGEMDTRIRLRYASALAAMDNTWRAVIGATVYEFVSAINVRMENHTFEVMCRTGVRDDAA